MASARINMRLDGELWGWVAVYAKRRDVTRTLIVEAALREFREACEGGVPELEETSSRPEGRGSRGRGGLTPTPAHASPASSASPRAPELEQASVDDTQAASPAGRSSGQSHAGHHASATGAASARGASRPPAPARAPSLEKPHIASAREMHPVARPAQSEWERTMRSRQQRLNRGKG